MADAADPADRPPSGLEDTAVAATQDPDPDPPAPGELAAPRLRLVHAGDALGRYTLDDEVGEGGMATVFRARDRELRREVAIKVLFPHLARKDEVVRRFHREARAAAGLEHPNILRVFDIGGGAGGDPPFIVMELIRGRSLLAEIEQRGAMLTEVVAGIGALLADALGAAHAAGIVHRDVKPANVLIAPGGRLLLADFGVARLETEDSLVTKTGAVLGTPAYMSPEQARGDTSTRQSDLYSLGVTLYQLATGSLPYSGSPGRVLAAIATGGFAPAVRRRAAVGAELSRVIDRLMAIEPAARPADAAGVAAELRAIATAGGLGDPTAELAAYFADPAAFVGARTPVVVAALVRGAERAIADGKLPRAMALADRASALAPADPAVVRLVAVVTAGDRAAGRRRIALLAGVAVAIVGGAAAGGHAWLAGGAAAPPDAAAPMPTLPIAVVVAAPPDAAVIAIAPPDAALGPDAAIAAAMRPIARADARVADAAEVAVADASPSPLPDAPAAPPASPAPPADGAIVVRNDTWCDLFLDDAPSGRLQPPAAVTLRAAPGHHVLRCEQRDQGRAWRREVDVPAGGSVTAAGALLGKLVVAIETPDLRIDGALVTSGTIVHLTHGAHRFELGATVARLDIAVDCALRVRTADAGHPELACVPTR